MDRTINQRSIAWRLAGQVLLAGAVVLAVCGWLSFRASAMVAERALETRARLIAGQAALLLSGELQQLEQAADGLAAELLSRWRGKQSLARPELVALLSRVLTAQREAHAFGIVRPTGEYLVVARHAPPERGPGRPPGPGRGPAEPWSAGLADFGTAGPPPFVTLTRADRAEDDRQWLAAILSGRPAGWLVPERPRPPAAVLTFFRPLGKPGADEEKLARSVAGVILQLPVPRLSHTLQQVALGPEAQASLLTADGRFLAHQDLGQLFQPAPFWSAIATGPEDGEQDPTGERYVALPAGVLGDDPAWVAVAPVDRGGWSIAVSQGLAEHRLNMGQLQLSLILVSVIGLLILGIGGLVIGTAVSRPLRQLEEAAGRIARGELEQQTPIAPGDDEVTRLGVSFETMRRELRHQLQRLQRATAARERMESEIRIARTIQESLLPHTFPRDPRYDVAGDLIAARQVGGDLYAVRLLDDDTLFIAVGDVTDKGVPAALFMAVTNTLLHSLLNHQHAPGPLLTALNDAVSEGNESGMFVTFFAAVLDARGGECRYANGGHNPPLLCRVGHPPEPLTDAAGMALGVIEGVPYDEGRLVFGPGDGLLLYTDGVNEAMNAAGELFGLDRAGEALGDHPAETAAKTIERLEEHLAFYVSGAPQADDITVVMLRYRGRP